jgi:hypothetical protein
MNDRTATTSALLVFTIIGWATLTLWVFTTDVVAAATLVPLVVLAAGLEGLIAFHGPTLFAPLFAVAIAVNFLPAAVSGTTEELVGIGLAHALFAVRLIIAIRRRSIAASAASSISKSAPAE